MQPLGQGSTKSSYGKGTQREHIQHMPVTYSFCTGVANASGPAVVGRGGVITDKPLIVVGAAEEEKEVRAGEDEGEDPDVDETAQAAEADDEAE